MSRHISFNKRSGEGQSIGLYRDSEIHRDSVWATAFISHTEEPNALGGAQGSVPGDCNVGLSGGGQAGGRVSLALVGASIAILIEKMAAAGPLGVCFRATLSNSMKFFWLSSLLRKE